MANHKKARAPRKKSWEKLFEELRAVYSSKGKEGEFEQEKETYKDLLPKLLDEIDSAFVLVKPRAIGSTATVWVVWDKGLRQNRALKLARPRFYKDIDNIIFVIRGEGDLLAQLNHQNIIKVYASGEVLLQTLDTEFSFPYFVMEFFEEIDDLDVYIRKNIKTLNDHTVIEIFRDLIAGIAFLHEKRIVHCDIKPGNLQIGPDGRALVADLGYAKGLRIPTDDAKETYVSYTPSYAHPVLRTRMKENKDSNANIAKIPQNELKGTFDLFAFGRSMQEVLQEIRKTEKEEVTRQFGRNSIFSAYQWAYLSYISKRLLDGIVENVGGETDLQKDIIPGLTTQVMEELKYTCADEVLGDFEKLLNLYDLEGDVAELNPNIANFTQIPHCSVPLTERVEKVINHPIFARLSQITQLGFVSLIYPGSSHTRFEHVLGTFAHCCDYLRALWYDQASGLFQCIMSPQYLELGMLSALLHDIGQYPMAHDLTEISTNFAHERLTETAFAFRDPRWEESLSEVVESYWGVSTDDVMNVINANEDSPFRYQILKSVISGPLDCDKLDYLKRDSTHLGVKFGTSIDDQRLMRNLTIAYNSISAPTRIDGELNPETKLEFAEIGVTEKALVVAEGLWKARKDMFTQVYWQHTTRALKAMLAYVVRNILRRFDDKSEAIFWRDLSQFIFSPTSYCGSAQITVADENQNPQKNMVSFEEEENKPLQLLFTHLNATDDALLSLLSRFAEAKEIGVINAIRSRSVYERFKVLSESRERKNYTLIYDKFRARQDDPGKLEEIREHWESDVIELAAKKMREKPNLIPTSVSLELFEEGLRTTQPLLLFDVPVKGSGLDTDKEKIPYLPEDLTGVHSPSVVNSPIFVRKEIELVSDSFDKDVGKIRILAHPRFRNFFVRSVADTEVVKLLKTHLTDGP